MDKCEATDYDEADKMSLEDDFKDSQSIIVFTCMTMSAGRHGKSHSAAKSSSSWSSRPFSTAACNSIHKPYAL